ncbi:hypothetical protein BBJ28_00009415 [Nothophytophthora sp. Chile5]|nr:hypothetical protein BBJ28_00009415 [Nothophytophthora sp. Chile5]
MRVLCLSTASLECFERALELTSVNCGFCRRRVVGFARTKQYKVDETLWQAIRAECPFLGDHADLEPLVEFFDEDAPPLHNGGEDHPTSHQESSGEIKAFYEQQLRAHQSEVEAAEARALEQTMEFLQSDPDTRSTSHRPVTRSKPVVDGSKQQRLDRFFGSSRATSSHSGTSHGLRRAHSATIGLMSPRTRSRVKLDESHTKYFLRSASHSPPKQRRQPVHGRKALFQLKLDTKTSPIALHTRAREQEAERKPTKMLTRQGRRRSSWKCAECTFQNTCFDSRCSMCHSVPPPEAFTSFVSQ